MSGCMDLSIHAPIASVVVRIRYEPNLGLSCSCSCASLGDRGSCYQDRSMGNVIYHCTSKWCGSARYRCKRRIPSTSHLRFKKRSSRDTSHQFSQRWGVHLYACSWDNYYDGVDQVTQWYLSAHGRNVFSWQWDSSRTK